MTVLRWIPIAVAAVATATASHAAATGPAVTGLDVSAAWISARAGDPDGELTVGFSLPEPGAVVFSLRQVAPRCRGVGRFAVRGLAGRNEFVFPGRLDRRLLPRGTYHLTAPSTGARPVRVVFAVVTGPPTPTELAKALRRDVCEGSAATRPAVEPPPARPAQPRGGVLGARFEEPAAESALRPVVIGCLLLAIALLGVAAMPAAVTPGARTAELVMTRRPVVALAGFLVLAAAVALYLASLV